MVYSMKKTIHPLVLLSILLLSVWILCYPVSEYCAEKSFKAYMEEYNIEETDIREYKILKPFFFSEIDIAVKYKTDPAYEYHYYYPLCNITDNLPMFVIIYSGNVSIGSENHSLVKYPPVSRK